MRASGVVGIFHSGFGAIAVAPKLRRNGSVDVYGAMDEFSFQSGLEGAVLVEKAPLVVPEGRLCWREGRVIST